MKDTTITKKVYTKGQIIDLMFRRNSGDSFERYDSQSRKLFFDRPETEVNDSIRSFANFWNLEIQA